MAPAAEYDALIVGARVAGASLAIRLAQQGRRVLLVDRDSFPSDTISTHGLGFTAVESLNRLGVLEKLEAEGFRRMYRHRAWMGDVLIEAPAGPLGGYTLAPRRLVLDQILIERAVECGAVFMERARVDGLLVEAGDVIGASVQRIGGEAFDVSARIVVGADGKSSQIAGWVGAPTYNEHPPGRPIYYGYFRGVESLPEPAMELFFGGDRVGFCFPMRADEHCLIIESQPQDFERIRQDPHAWLLEHLAALPGMAKRMRDASIEGQVKGIRSVRSHFRKPYGDGWALTGDAAYLKDPITGYGVGDALLQGFWLAKSLGDWLDGADWEPTMSAYQQRRDMAFRPFYDQTHIAVDARDIDDQLNDLRAALVSQHDAGHLMRMLPSLYDAAFEPMDRFRHALIKNMFEAAQQPASVSATQE